MVETMPKGYLHLPRSWGKATSPLQSSSLLFPFDRIMLLICQLDLRASF